MQQYEPAEHGPQPSLPAAPMAAALKLAFPGVLTPYGIAAVIALLASSPNASRTVLILAILGGVMVLNLLAMLFARQIMRGATLLVMQVLGSVLSVLQVALALQIIIMELRALGALPA
jgi:multiple antibiotic resistance protein